MTHSLPESARTSSDAAPITRKGCTVDRWSIQFGRNVRDLMTVNQRIARAVSLQAQPMGGLQAHHRFSSPDVPGTAAFADYSEITAVDHALEHSPGLRW